MNASSAKKNVLLLFKGEKISFSDVGKIIYYLSHLVLTFAQNAGGGQGPTQGVQDDYNYPPTCVHYNGTSRERLPLHVSASRCNRGYHSKLVYHVEKRNLVDVKAEKVSLDLRMLLKIAEARRRSERHGDGLRGSTGK